jgi:hypothetical protein
VTLERRPPDQSPGVARLLRKQPTRAEELLCERLRDSRFHGAIPGLRPYDIHTFRTERRAGE